jgi:hypothetical protein
MAFADRCDEGREPHPLRPLGLAANLMVKPGIGGAGMALLWVRRWARLPFPSYPQEVLPQRGDGLRSPSGVGLPGVQDGDDGPLPRSPENDRFAGGKSVGSGVRALWGSNGLTCLSLDGLVWLRDCHNGCMAFAHEQGSGWLGVQEGDPAG